METKYDVEPSNTTSQNKSTLITIKAILIFIMVFVGMCMTMYGIVNLRQPIGASDYEHIYTEDISELNSSSETPNLCNWENCEQRAIKHVGSSHIYSYSIVSNKNYRVDSKSFTSREKSSKEVREDVKNGKWRQLESNLRNYGSVAGKEQTHNYIEVNGYYCSTHASSGLALITKAIKEAPYRKPTISLFIGIALFIYPLILLIKNFGHIVAMFEQGY